ncbi:hypothetical protein EAO14_01400 [Klebsiella pneumoniae]|nr:hypothetical protein EAO14_01400 [Klebsiella pneumoniae]
MRGDLARYKDEAKDLHCRLMELAEVANLRKQILPVSKTVIAKLKIYETGMIETTSYAEDVMTGSVVVARHVLITFDNRVQPVYGEEMYGLFTRMGER